MSFCRIFRSVNYKEFHTSCLTRKQPPQDTQRWKRNLRPPFQKVRFVDEAPLYKIASYPEVMPKYPPGSWGSFPPDKAWKWHKRSEILKSKPSAFATIREFYELEKNAWHHRIKLPLEFPETLEFSQYLTRTSIIDDLPTIHSPDAPLDEATLATLSKQLERTIINEISSKNRDFIFSHDTNRKVDSINVRIASLMEAFYGALAGRSGDHHLRDVHVDERAKVETWLKRTGYEDLVDVDPTVRDEDGCVKFTVQGENSWQMRAKNPLPQFVDMDDPICTEMGYPLYNHHPEMFDLEPVDCFSYEYTPLAYKFHSREFVRSIAGHWGRTPFYEGDPCEFGLLGAMNSRRSTKLCADYEEHPDILARHALAEGILTAFAWTSAQAFNQGFTMYNELTYPFTAQLVLTDGRLFRILCYQLNSLTGTWKPEDAGLPMNLAWATPEVPLFDHVTESGEVSGLNLDLIQQLASLFLLQPRQVPASSKDLRGDRLQDEPAPRDVTRFINMTDEEPLPRKRPPRLQTPRAPHPNDVFYFKETTKRDILEDIRETFPNLGRLPQPYEEKVRAHLKLKKFRKGRYKTLKPPSLWQ